MQLTGDVILEKHTRHNFNWWLYSTLYETLHGRTGKKAITRASYFNTLDKGKLGGDSTCRIKQQGGFFQVSHNVRLSLFMQ